MDWNSGNHKTCAQETLAIFDGEKAKVKRALKTGISRPHNNVEQKKSLYNQIIFAHPQAITKCIA